MSIGNLGLLKIIAIKGVHSNTPEASEMVKIVRLDIKVLLDSSVIKEKFYNK